MYQFDINGDFSQVQCSVNVERQAFTVYRLLLASSSKVLTYVNQTTLSIYSYNPNPPKYTSTSSTVSTTGSTAATTVTTGGALNYKYSLSKKNRDIYDAVKRIKDKNGINIRKVKLNLRPT